MKVVVLSGGRSSEHEVSLRSGEAVAAGLRQGGHDVVPVMIDRHGRWLHGEDEIELKPGRGLLEADAVFPVLHGPYGEDGIVQGALEVLGVAYVGSGVLASALCIDKIVFKRQMAFHGLPQVEFADAGEAGWRQRVEGFGWPVWVKPSRLGSSVGITKVEDAAALDEAVEQARRHDPRVIVEAHCPGREVECSVIGNDSPQASVPGEVIAKGEWYDFSSKYEPGGMELVAPADLDDGPSAQVRDLAAQVFSVCGCSGLARCDFFVTAGNEVLVNELNTLPGFTDTSVFAKLWEASGLAYPELCDRLLRLALERHEAERSYRF